MPYYFLVLLIFMLQSCSATRSIRPLGAGNMAIGADIGGPLVRNLAVPIPLPLPTIFGKYGLQNKLDIDFGLHLPLAKACGVDGGFAYQVLNADHMQPALLLGARLLWFINTRSLQNNTVYTLDSRLFEEISAIASWDLQQDLLGFAGVVLFSQIAPLHLRPSLLVGIDYLVSPSWHLQADLKWISFLTDQHFLTANYVGIGGYGALDIQVGISYYFSAGYL